MIVLAIDPGDKVSALVWYDVVTARVLDKMIIGNDEAAEILTRADVGAEHLVIEMAESFGAKVWGQVFETVFWTGRFVQAWARPFTRVTRREVKKQVAGEHRANDSQIRNALIDRWGGKDVAIGNKKAPGPLFGVTADCWQALAAAVTYADRVREEAA